MTRLWVGITGKADAAEEVLETAEEVSLETEETAEEVTALETSVTVDEVCEETSFLFEQPKRQNARHIARIKQSSFFIFFFPPLF
jgi:hypothetical protein